MFSHLMIGANDLDASKKFYDATLAVFGYDAGVYDEHGRLFYFTPKGILALTNDYGVNPEFKLLFLPT